MEIYWTILKLALALFRADNLIFVDVRMADVAVVLWGWFLLDRIGKGHLECFMDEGRFILGDLTGQSFGLLGIHLESKFDKIICLNSLVCITNSGSWNKIYKKYFESCSSFHLKIRQIDTQLALRLPEFLT